LGAIIATLHKADFGKSSSTNAGMTGGGASVYMEELVSKLSFTKSEILDKYAGIDIARRWSVFSSFLSVIFGYLV
jgi:conserved oligomeric Golgi complex subunit 5